MRTNFVWERATLTAAASYSPSPLLVRAAAFAASASAAAAPRPPLRRRCAAPPPRRRRAAAAPLLRGCRCASPAAARACMFVWHTPTLPGRRPSCASWSLGKRDSSEKFVRGDGRVCVALREISFDVVAPRGGARCAVCALRARSHARRTTLACRFLV